MKVKKFQEGGMAPEQAASMGGAPVQGGEQANPEEQLAQIAQEIISQMGPEAAAMLAQIILQMLQGGAQQEQPVFAKLGTKIHRVK